MESESYTKKIINKSNKSSSNALHEAFNWNLWKQEVILSKPKEKFNIEELRSKYAEFDLNSQEAIKTCNAFAKAKCKAVVSGQKVHILASLPHVKHANSFDWSGWLSAGLKALKKRSEKAHISIINEVAEIGERLSEEDQQFFSECIEYFLLNGLQSLYNGYYKGLLSKLENAEDVIIASEKINNWSEEEHKHTVQFFY